MIVEHCTTWVFWKDYDGAYFQGYGNKTGAEEKCATLKRLEALNKNGNVLIAVVQGVELNVSVKSVVDTVQLRSKP